MDDLLKQLRGRALFLRRNGEIKSPMLLEEAANYIEKINSMTGLCSACGQANGCEETQ